MTKLLIVDDSPLMRRLLSEIFASAGDFEIAVARSGAEALGLLDEFAPDVITLDIHMPEMNGLECLDAIMLHRPCPVVMVSALSAEGADVTLEAMSLGAVDFIAKPKGAVSLHIAELAPALIEKVRTAATARISRAARLTERVRLRTRAAGAPPAVPRAPVSAGAGEVRPLPGGGDGLVLIGTSTGGPPALDQVLGALPADLPWPVVVAQHMPASFTGSLAKRLDRLCQIAVTEVVRPTALLPGHAYIARGDADIVISRRPAGLVAMPAPKNPDHFWHPSVDRLVESAMRVVDPGRLIAVLMTGMGSDGASAMSALHVQGGFTIAESAETAVVWGMPGALAAKGGASVIQRVDQIAATLVSLLSR